MESVRSQTWATFAALAAQFYASGAPADSVVADAWFAALSRTSSAELNVCGLGPGTNLSGTAKLLRTLGDDQAAIVFTSEDLPEGCCDLLTGRGFLLADVPEPLMRCAQPPSEQGSVFAISRAGRGDLRSALCLTSSAHAVEIGLLDATIGDAARSGVAQVWLARDGREPISAVWLCRTETSIGVMEMMTPKRHQGRGAGRALLATALSSAWTGSTVDAVLLATPAGRRLYESLGFEAVDESRTYYRGLDDSVLDAIGQAP